MSCLLKTTTLCWLITKLQACSCKSEGPLSLHACRLRYSHPEDQSPLSQMGGGGGLYKNISESINQCSNRMDRMLRGSVYCNCYLCTVIVSTPNAKTIILSLWTIACFKENTRKRVISAAFRKGRLQRSHYSHLQSVKVLKLISTKYITVPIIFSHSLTLYLFTAYYL